MIRHIENNFQRVKNLLINVYLPHDGDVFSSFFFSLLNQLDV